MKNTTRPNFTHPPTTKIKQDLTSKVRSRKELFKASQFLFDLCIKIKYKSKCRPPTCLTDAIGGISYDK